MLASDGVMTEVQVILTHSKVVSSVHRVIVLPQDVQRKEPEAIPQKEESPKLGAHALNGYSEIVDKYEAISDARDITDGLLCCVMNSARGKYSFDLIRDGSLYPYQISTLKYNRVWFLGPSRDSIETKCLTVSIPYTILGALISLTLGEINCSS